jgi:hypothetical protein
VSVAFAASSARADVAMSVAAIRHAIAIVSKLRMMCPLRAAGSSRRAQTAHPTRTSASVLHNR